ncbi:uroporphyrinogen-III synthase, partial [Salmonella enterica]|uniref:uroporphyrinogen-III synthase n=1 Tax=Salmonella enterica TaxID=28901 RepID=UPI000B23B637
LVSRLRALGQWAWSFPTIELVVGRELPTLPVPLAPLTQPALVIALPQHAVAFPHPPLQRHGRNWPASPRYFATGGTTALALHPVSGFAIRHPLDREIREALLHLPALQTIAGNRALITRGNGRSELLGETLAASGAHV